MIGNKKLLILLLGILGILIIGCVEKPSQPNTTEQPKITEQPITGPPNFTEPPVNITGEKEKLEKEDRFMSTFEGPNDIENSENARTAIIPHLRELGYEGGINVVYGSSLTKNHTIIIVLPFQLTKNSTDFLNKTLLNYSFKPTEFNEKVEK
jgi:hypothetical protein